MPEVAPVDACPPAGDSLLETPERMRYALIPLAARTPLICEAGDEKSARPKNPTKLANRRIERIDVLEAAEANYAVEALVLNRESCRGGNDARQFAQASAACEQIFQGQV